MRIGQTTHASRYVVHLYFHMGIIMSLGKKEFVHVFLSGYHSLFDHVFQQLNVLYLNCLHNGTGSQQKLYFLHYF